MARYIGAIRRRTKLGGYEAYFIEKDTFWASSTHLLEDIASYCLNPTDKGDKVNITQWLFSIQYTTPWLFSILLHGCSVFSILHGSSVYYSMVLQYSVYYSVVVQYTTNYTHRLNQLIQDNRKGSILKQKVNVHID